MALPPPLLRSSQSGTGVLQQARGIMAGRTGLAGAAITTVTCVLLSLALWKPLEWPSDAIREVIPVASCRPGTARLVGTLCTMRTAATPLAAPLLLMIVAFVFRKGLATAVMSLKRRAPEFGILLAAAMATVVFVLSWAGSHAGRPMEFGLLPQIVFPGIVGFSTYATGRWGPLLHRGLRIYFDARDHISMKVRMLVMLVIPIALSMWLAGGASKSRLAYNEQLVVLVGIIISFLIVAPRPKQGGLQG
ncbi:MAG: hypothetical protein EPO65_10565 [Dehalococcoidia bacterium]|nr:MAG: hypothetical protein EPO65_10565 [Dehalococcoidia bacterium]